MSKKIYVISLFLLLLLPLVSAKSYTLEKAFVDITVNPEASIQIEEHIIFNFNGPFTFAFRDFSYDQEEIEDLRVYELKQGKKIELQTKITEINSHTTQIKWYYAAQDETKEFVITYTLKNSLKVYDDVAEFYWKIWGAGWDHPLREIEGNVLLPKEVNNSTEIYTWGHPQLEGTIALVENKKIIYQAFTIPAQQWVELRVIFPAELLTNPLYGQRIHQEGLPMIIQEEERYKNYPGTESKRVSFWFIVVNVLPSLTVIIVFLLLYLKMGREPKVKNYEQIYEREIPYTYSPALLSALLNQHNKKPSAQDFVAVILDLCLKGYLKMEVLKQKKILGIFGPDTDYEIIFMKKDINKLTKQEQQVITVLKKYSTGGKISFTSLQK